MWRPSLHFIFIDIFSELKENQIFSGQILITDLVPSLHLPPTSQVGVGQQVDVVSQLGHGGEDEDHRGEDHHSHRGEGVELKI